MYIYFVQFMNPELRETTKYNITQKHFKCFTYRMLAPHSLYTAADSKIVIICEHQAVDNRITAGCVSSLCQFTFCLLISQACESTGYTDEYFGTSIQDIFLKTWKVGSWPIACSFLLFITFRPVFFFFENFLRRDLPSSGIYSVLLVASYRRFGDNLSVT